MITKRPGPRLELAERRPTTSAPESVGKMAIASAATRKPLLVRLALVGDNARMDLEVWEWACLAGGWRFGEERSF